MIKNYNYERMNDHCIKIRYGINTIRIMAYYTKHIPKLELLITSIDKRKPDLVSLLEKAKKNNLIIL
jgi:hypothetical protein